jgi:hypothetical protein
MERELWMRFERYVVADGEMMRRDRDRCADGEVRWFLYALEMEWVILGGLEARKT